MLFLLVAHDKPGTGAAVQRIRSSWMQNVAAMAKSGEMFAGGAINQDGVRMGSFALLNFPSRSEAQSWIERHPYTTEGVWASAELLDASLAPPFLGG
jgi:uncharacterized protein YciI